MGVPISLVGTPVPLPANVPASELGRANRLIVRVRESGTLRFLDEARVEVFVR